MELYIVKEFIGIWVIEKESGLPLTSYETGSQIDSNMFGAFLVALRSMMSDFEIGQLSSFSTDTSNLLITTSEKLLSVLAIEKEINADCWYPLLVKVHEITEKYYCSYILDHPILDSEDFVKLSSEFKKQVENHQEILELSQKKRKEEAEAKKRMEESGLW